MRQEYENVKVSDKVTWLVCCHNRIMLPDFMRWYLIRHIIIISCYKTLWDDTLYISWSYIVARFYEMISYTYHNHILLPDFMRWCIIRHITIIYCCQTLWNDILYMFISQSYTVARLCEMISYTCSYHDHILLPDSLRWCLIHLIMIMYWYHTLWDNNVCISWSYILLPDTMRWYLIHIMIIYNCQTLWDDILYNTMIISCCKTIWH